MEAGDDLPAVSARRAPIRARSAVRSSADNLSHSSRSLLRDGRRLVRVAVAEPFTQDGKLVWPEVAATGVSGRGSHSGLCSNGMTSPALGGASDGELTLGACRASR